MTDTIDVAALVERLVDLIENDDHERLCQGREYTCSCGYDERKDAALAEAATALQSQAAALAEARRERAAIAEYEARDKSIPIVRHLMTYAAAVATWKARATTAEASLATMREALEDARIEIEAAKLFGGGFYGERVTTQAREFYRDIARRALGGSNAD